MRYFLLFLIIGSCASCKKDFASKEIETAYLSVMQVHDEVMPQISDIQRLKRQLKKIKVKSDEVAELKNRLEAADDGMMDWMREFKLDKSASIPAQLAYLSEEQVRINKVSYDMKDSIKKATAFLKENNIND